MCVSDNMKLDLVDQTSSRQPWSHSQHQRKKTKTKPTSRALLATLLFSLASLLSVSKAAFSGQVETSQSQISTMDVTYTFRLEFIQQIPQDGKLVIRFPANFTGSFNSPVCKSLSGFSIPADSDLNCEYLDSVRLLTIYDGFPTTFTELRFTVDGVTNPPFANQTDYFKVESLKRSGGDYIPLEASNDFITVTPTPGSLSGETLSLSSNVVGAYSTLTVEI